MCFGVEERKLQELNLKVIEKISYLNTVVASCDPSILDLDVGWWMRELALSIRPRTLVPLELPAYFQL